MSAITGHWASGRWRFARTGRPSYGRLLRASFSAQLMTACCLFVIQLLLMFAAAWPYDNSRGNLWLPWHIDGMWAALGAAAWALMVTRIISRMVCDRLILRDVPAPSLGWTQIAVGAGNYGALLVGTSLGTHILVALLATPLCTMVIGYRLDGSPRTSLWKSTRRLRIGIGAATLLLILAYTSSHAFSNPSRTYGGYEIEGWHDTDVTTSTGIIPSDVTGVSLVSDAGSALRLRSYRLVLREGGNGQEALGGGNGQEPRLSFAKDTPLPFHIPVKAGLSISLAYGLRGCSVPSATITGVKLNYTIAGIATSQIVPMDGPVQIRCHR